MLFLKQKTSFDVALDMSMLSNLYKLHNSAKNSPCFLVNRLPHCFTSPNATTFCISVSFNKAFFNPAPVSVYISVNNSPTILYHCRNVNYRVYCKHTRNYIVVISEKCICVYVHNVELFIYVVNTSLKNLIAFKHFF